GGRDDRAQPELGGGSGQARQEQGFGLLGSHAGQARPIPVDEADAAGRATLGVDRDPRRTELLDVAVDRPDRHLELARQLRAGHATALLQEEQQIDQATGAHPDRVPPLMTGCVRYYGRWLPSVPPSSRKRSISEIRWSPDGSPRSVTTISRRH